MMHLMSLKHEFGLLMLLIFSFMYLVRELVANRCILTYIDIVFGATANFDHMKQGNILLIDLEFEYKLWKRRLELFDREMRCFCSRNDELRSLKGRKELDAAQIDELMKHQKNVESLLNRIKVLEQELQYYNKDFPITAMHQYFVDHIDLRDRIQQALDEHIHLSQELLDALSV